MKSEKETILNLAEPNNSIQKYIVYNVIIHQQVFFRINTFFFQISTQKHQLIQQKKIIIIDYSLY